MPRSTKVGTAFIPVHDPRTSARWYERALGLRAAQVGEWAAQLEDASGRGAVLTLMGPRSGISAEPGLPFATCNFLVADLRVTRDRLHAEGLAPSPVEGSEDVCLFFTLKDPDGNVLLVVDR